MGESLAQFNRLLRIARAGIDDDLFRLESRPHGVENLCHLLGSKQAKDDSSTLFQRVVGPCRSSSQQRLGIFASPIRDSHGIAAGQQSIGQGGAEEASTDEADRFTF